MLKLHYCHLSLLPIIYYSWNLVPWSSSQCLKTTGSRQVPAWFLMLPTFLDTWHGKYTLHFLGDAPSSCQALTQRAQGEFYWFGLKVKQSVLDLRKLSLRNPSRAHKRGLETWPSVGLLMRLESYLILVFNQLINYFNMIFSFFFFFLKRCFFLTAQCCQEYSRVFGNFLWNMPFAFIFMTSLPSRVWRSKRGKEHLGKITKCRVRNQTEILGSQVQYTVLAIFIANQVFNSWSRKAVDSGSIFEIHIHQKTTIWEKHPMCVINNIFITNLFTQNLIP